MPFQRKIVPKSKRKLNKLAAKHMNEIIRKRKRDCTSEAEITPDVKRPALCNKDEKKTSKNVYHELEPVALEQNIIPGEMNIEFLNQDASLTTNECELQAANIEMGETSYVVEVENTPENEIEIGRRIINVSKFFNKLKEISNHGPFDCRFSSLQLVDESLHGLSSKLIFLCKMCNRRFVVESDDDDSLPVNTCAVAATISIGCGHSQLQQFLSAINLPIISHKTYKANHKQLSENWELLAQKSMDEAAEEERNIAKSEGRVTKDGTPIIDVIIDGVYSKRSYKKNYSALSGAAAIIGRKTGKILYMGVRNKYCYHCDRAQKKNVTAPNHFCCKNYSGPSTGMESEIIVEGFRKSLSTHGLIYGRMISDGDSSTYSKILQARPYKDITVEKIECRNHLLRNFCNKLQSLQTDTKYPVNQRKALTTTRILIMRSTIIKSIKKNKSNPCPQEEHLFDDISTAHHHAFGNHVKCKAHFCDKMGQVEQTDILKEFHVSSLFQKISLLIQSIAGHARSLLHDVDSNVVECYHSIIAKYVGGKRINFSFSDSYKTRCTASAVSFNEENALSKLYKQISHKSPRGKLKMLEDRICKSKLLSKKYIKKKTRQPFVQKTKDDKSYGDKCEKPDVPTEILERMKKDFLNSLKKTDEERALIQKRTILQRASGEWLEMRRSLLTASNFSKVVKRRKTTPCANLVKEILYKKNLEHVESIKHGIQNEKTALAQLSLQENVVINPCGLFIDKDDCFLAASPDGLVGEDILVEVKCPLTANKLGLDEAVRTRKVVFWKITETGEWIVNKKHPWYYQIQGQLHVTQRKYCLFGVWVNETEPVKTEMIERDDEFWNKQMKAKLTKFYIDCLLPEILDPRISRNMNIREPYIIKKHKDNDDIVEEKGKSEDDDEEKENNAPGPSTSYRYLDYSNY